MSFITTRSGREIALLAPNPVDFDIEDIAYGLARAARFNGQTLRTYTVAQHSVLVSRIVPIEHALAALLHDASEAYLGDVTTPVKNCVVGYREIENLFMSSILRRFGLPVVMPYCVKKADLVALATERRDLLPQTRTPWRILDGVPPLPERIRALPERSARKLFFERFHELAVGCSDATQ